MKKTVLRVVLAIVALFLIGVLVSCDWGYEEEGILRERVSELEAENTRLLNEKKNLEDKLEERDETIRAKDEEIERLIQERANFQERAQACKVFEERIESIKDRLNSFKDFVVKEARWVWVLIEPYVQPIIDDVELLWEAAREKKP
jgi:chromosome segregation ATPase